MESGRGCLLQIEEASERISNNNNNSNSNNNNNNNNNNSNFYSNKIRLKPI